MTPLNKKSLGHVNYGQLQSAGDFINAEIPS